MQTPSVQTRVPKQGRSRQSFARVVEATIELLGQRSYDQITLADICQLSGVSTGSLYGRVSGKDELLRIVQVRVLERLGERFEERSQFIKSHASGLSEVVPAVVAGLGSLLKEHASVLRAFMLRAPSDPVIAAAGRASAEANHAKFIDLIRTCRSEIRHPDPERAIGTSFLLIYATQARYLGLDSVEGIGDANSWTTLLEDLSDMMLAFLQFVPAR